jgi:hypothetical protein
MYDSTRNGWIVSGYKIFTVNNSLRINKIGFK